MNVEEALVILDTALKQQGLNDIQELIFRQAWEGQSYPKMAESSGYDANYVKDVGSKLWKLLSNAFEEEVTKSNFRSVIRRHSCSVSAANSVSQEESQQVRAYSNTPLPNTEDIKVNYQDTKTKLLKVDVKGTTRQDWGEAIDVPVFYGRTEELNTLKQWLVCDRCRLVALLGMGGIGKTALSLRCSELVQDEFEYLIWRSLRNAPPIQETLLNLIQFLSNQQETEVDLPKDLDGRVSRLIDYLRCSRCLLILDNVETILGDGDYAGHYREGYEGYGELFRRLGEARHQSCLILTSREKPKEFVSLEGEKLPVRSLQITGLKEAEGREIFRLKGAFSGSEEEWRIIVEHYAGNPLALKMVAAAIQELLNSNISEFLELLNQGTLVFDDIRDVLERQFDRLSDLEKEIMYWLAIEHEPILLLELRENVLSPVAKSTLR